MLPLSAFALAFLAAAFEPSGPVLLLAYATGVPAVLLTGVRQAGFAPSFLIVGLMVGSALLAWSFDLPALTATAGLVLACTAVSRAPSGLRRVMLAVLGVAAALTANWSADTLLATAAFFPTLLILVWAKDRDPYVFIAKVAALLMLSLALKNSLLPWNGVRGMGLWIVLAAATSGAAVSIRGLALPEQRFSTLALIIGGLLLVAILRRAHDPTAASVLVLSGVVVVEFVLGILVGAQYVRTQAEPEIRPPERCIVPLLDRKEVLAVEERVD